MSDPLEDIIRTWGRAGGHADALPAAPTRERLTFAQAERLAAGDAGDERDDPNAVPLARRQHVLSCACCAKLVADFRAAIAEEHAPAAAAAAPARPARVIHLRRLVPVAAAAIVLLAAGILLFQQFRPAGPLLASADVGLVSDIEQGLTPKGPPVFASGERITLRVRLARPAYVAVFNIDATGRVQFAAAGTGAGAPATPSPAGDLHLGPYPLDENVGPEWFLVVAAKDPLLQPPDIAQGRRMALQGLYNQTHDVHRLVAAARSWDAEAQLIAFEHVAKR